MMWCTGSGELAIKHLVPLRNGFSHHSSSEYVPINITPSEYVRYDPHPGHTDKELSQTLSNILRHAAHAFRIVLQPDGFANLSDVLNACNRTIDEGLNVARTSRKYGQAR